jgi:hypothetical protein
LVDPPSLVERVKTLAQSGSSLDRNGQSSDSLPDFEDIYKREFTDLDEGIDSLLEKMAILTHLYSREF